MIVYKEYNRARAVEYARTWALSRNPLFLDFTGRGGDCTNYISQCVYAGCCVMNFTENFGWYFISSANRAPAWTGVEFFYDFITGAANFSTENGNIGPFGVEVDSSAILEGDIIQLADNTGDFYHTLIITGFQDGEPLICAHSNDALDKPLSSYNYASLRYIHIEAIRMEVMADSCFENLITGTSIGLPDEENL